MDSLSYKEQIILGTLLGDGYYNIKKGSIRMLHTEKQIEYLNWKARFVDGIYGPYKREVYLKKYNKIYNEFYYEIPKNKLYNIKDFIKANLYKKDNEGRYIKKISLKYLEKLTPLSLAVWWMDDGSLCLSKANRYGKLCTHNFNYEENLLIKKYFYDKWRIKVDVKKEKDKYYFIRFNTKAMQQLISIIYEYVCEVPSMIYKIDLKYKRTGCINKLLDGFDDIYNYIKSHNCIE